MSREDGRKMPLIYTPRDAFGGYGGTSRGACAARLHVVWRFDQDLDSMKIYSASTTYARCEVIAANDIVTVLHDYCKIDILHDYHVKSFHLQIPVLEGMMRAMKPHSWLQKNCSR